MLPARREHASSAPASTCGFSQGRFNGMPEELDHEAVMEGRDGNVTSPPGAQAAQLRRIPPSSWHRASNRPAEDPADEARGRGHVPRILPFSGRPATVTNEVAMPSVKRAWPRRARPRRDDSRSAVVRRGVSRPAGPARNSHSIDVPEVQSSTQYGHLVTAHGESSAGPHFQRGKLSLQYSGWSRQGAWHDPRPSHVPPGSASRKRTRAPRLGRRRVALGDTANLRGQQVSQRWLRHVEHNIRHRAQRLMQVLDRMGTPLSWSRQCSSATNRSGAERQQRGDGEGCRAAAPAQPGPEERRGRRGSCPGAATRRAQPGGSGSGTALRRDSNGSRGAWSNGDTLPVTPTARRDIPPRPPRDHPSSEPSEL
jgi:hypothetical protein